MGVRPIMAAHREAARRSVHRPSRADRTVIELHVRGLAKSAVTQYRKHRNRTTEVVGDQEVTAARMNADIGGARTAGSYRVEEPQSAVGPIDNEGAGSALLILPDAVGFIRRVEPGSCGIQDETTRAGAQLDDA